MSEVLFYGQQEGERVLYEIHSHPLIKWLKLAKVGAAGMLIMILVGFVGSTIADIGPLIAALGFVLGLLVIVVGWLVITFTGKNDVAYATDRRVVRFSSVTPWVSNSRNLTWDEVVKVKTHSPNFILRLLNIGTIVIHARTTILPGSVKADVETQEQMATNDDITLTGVEYYKDLGNYMDKILYLYKKEPEQLKTLRTFVPKPRGKRY